MRPLANTKTFHVLEKYGFKNGFLGFAEESWTELFNPQIDCIQLKYQDWK